MWVETFGGRTGLTIPHLPAGSVAPFEGSPGDTFTYVVNYYHASGVAPTTAQLVVDGVARDMTRSTGSDSNATYRASTTLPVGYSHRHSLRFTFPGGNARLPASGAFDGPRVHGDAPDLDIPWLAVPDGPWWSGTPVTIRAYVHNRGTSTASDATVRFYLGDPATGGTAIGQVGLSLQPDVTREASLTWAPAVPGQHYLYIVAEPDGQIAEWSEENNVGRVQVSILHTHNLYLPLTLGGP
jgi:hypothetical protein